MDKLAVYLACLDSGIMEYKGALLHLFSIKKDETFDFSCDSGSIRGDGKIISIRLGETLYIADWWKKGSSLYQIKEEVTLSPKQIINIDKKVKTTYGRLLLNFILLTSHFGDKIAYQDGNWHSDKLIYRVMDQVATNDSITADEAHSFVNAIQFISSLTQICVPSASEKALSTDPKVKAKRKELLAKYKDNLDDPATIAKIEQELIAIDKDWIKGDPAEGFYISSKSYNIVRKRAHIMHGGERNFLDESKMTLIPSSLDEGWDMEYLPEMINSLRDGSYSRGAATAIGGERVKKFQQVFQNANVSMDDCKSKMGLDYTVDEDNHKFFIGRTLLSGKLLSKDNISSYIGKNITLRSPMFCKTEKTDYCKVCSGERVSEHPNAINMLSASIGSVFMLREMAKTHGKELLTRPFPLKDLVN